MLLAKSRTPVLGSGKLPAPKKTVPDSQPCGASPPPAEENYKAGEGRPKNKDNGEGKGAKTTAQARKQCKAHRENKKKGEGWGE